MLPEDLKAYRALEEEVLREREERVKRLRAVFDGAIRYWPMLDQHPEWSDEECVKFAMKWHAKAVEQFKAVGKMGWNWGIPYCRNDHTKANLGL